MKLTKKILREMIEEAFQVVKQSDLGEKDVKMLTASIFKVMMSDKEYFDVGCLSILQSTLPKMMSYDDTLDSKLRKRANDAIDYIGRKVNKLQQLESPAACKIVLAAVNAIKKVGSTTKKESKQIKISQLRHMIREEIERGLV